MLRWQPLVMLACAGCGFTTAGIAPIDGAAAHDGAASHDAARGSDAVTPTDAAARIALVQTSGGYASPWSDNSSSVSATLASNATAGDLIAVYVTYAGNTSLSTVTDSLGNAYTIVDTIDDGGNTQKSSTAYAKNIAGGADTITATFASSKCCRALIAHELHGADLSAPLDGHAGHQQSSTGTGTDAVTSNALTTTVIGDYIFAGTSDASNAGGQKITAGTGLQLRVNPVIPGGNPTASEDALESAGSGSVTSTFTFSKDGAALTLQMAFKP